MNRSRFIPLLILLGLAPGCPFSGSAEQAATTALTLASPTPTASASASPTVITGTPRAVKIIMKQAYPNGSFDAPSGAGTQAKPGSGHAATRVFNADGSLLSSTGPGSSTWPAWLTGFEVGISGSSNASATNSGCAKFADAGEADGSGGGKCNFSLGNPSSDNLCGAPGGHYRVSEYDCLENASTTLKDGTGGPSDGVYFRAYINRNHLGTAENLMMVLEYVAASFSPPSSNPINCFNNGVFSPEKCSDVTWKVFLKHSASEVVQPFLMLVPPTQNFANMYQSWSNATAASTTSSGANPTTKQIFIPLASDSALSVLQVSRISSSLNISSDNVKIACNNLTSAAGTVTHPANTPLCAGIVFYSVTLYRI